VSDSTPQLEQYIAAAKRQWWVVLQAMVVVGIVAAIFASREPDPPFRASTSFLVRPEYDTNGRVISTFAVTVSSQARNLTSPTVLVAAAEQVPGETPASIASTLGLSTDTTNGTITMTVTADDPARPLPIADAMAEAYIADRKAAKTETLGGLVADYDRQLVAIEQRIAELNQQIADATAAGSDTSTLAAASQAAISRYETTFSNRENAQSQIVLADPGVAVLNAATGVAQGEKTSPVERGLIGVGIGLVIGIGLAAVRETLDSRVRTRASVEHASGLTVIAELPEERIRSKNNELPIIDQPCGSLAESLRGLRTTLRYFGATEPIKSLVVTSPQSGDGKTVTAANLAASFAASGLRTILVSGDLRRPGVDEIFAAQGMVGVSDVLAGTWPGPPSVNGNGTYTNGTNGSVALQPPALKAETIQPLLRPSRLDLLWVLPAGRVPPNPSELLSSERAAQMFAALGELSDMVIVDSPPTIVADSTVLAGLVDAVVLVVALDRTRKGVLRQARQMLEPANSRLLGIALNRVRNSGGTYGGYYYAPNAGSSSPVRPVDAP
jgi:Mrp family chromosome partitioning ATPase/capsular polysaccharide biosynthesis protein